MPIDPTASAEIYEPVVKADADLPGGVCRALLVGVAGTANLTQPNGKQQNNVPLQQGVNPIKTKQVRLGGTADNIWALY